MLYHCRRQKRRPLVDGKLKHKCYFYLVGHSIHLSLSMFKWQSICIDLANICTPNVSTPSTSPSPRTMVDNAKAWAEERGLARRNSVHGEMEYRVPVEFSYSHTEKETLKTKVGAKTQMEAGPWCFPLWSNFHYLGLAGKLYFCNGRQGGKGLLLGSSADLTSEKAMLTRGRNLFNQQIS